MTSLKEKEIIKSKKAPAAVGPYSVAVRVGKMVFLSGQLGLIPETGNFIEGGVEEQTRQAMTNLKNVLEATGLTMENIVKTTVFLKDMHQFTEMNAVYGTFFNQEPPARSTVEVAALPKNGLVEIEAIAVDF